MSARQANPFPGLRPFEAHETHLFFGRDGQSSAIIGELQRTRFVAVVGTSGSGKSSLVRAGLLPQLEGGFMARAGSSWRFALMKPGDAPLRRLAQALGDRTVLGESADDAALRTRQIETVLRRGSLGLIDVVQQARLPAGDNVLVIVDQFEELFRMERLRSAAGQEEAAQFVAQLIEAARRTTLPIYVVLTMRSDFLGDCARFRDLPEALNRGQYLVPRMSRDDRRAAIEGPVAVGGGTIAPRLVQTILNDAGDDPDHLPLMQHALMRTWDTWADEGHPELPIDIEHYRRVGGLSEALSRHAEQALGEVARGRDRETARRIFQRLCERGDDYRETRRPTRLAELAAVTGVTEADVTRVIEPFRSPGRTFLLPPAPLALDGDSVIDISHEALIRQWGRLVEWVEQEAQWACLYRRVAEDAVRYARHETSLWRDPQLRTALDWWRAQTPSADWAARYHPGFDAARRFLDESHAAQRRWRFGKGALLGLLPLVLVAAGVAMRLQSDKAELVEAHGKLEAKTAEVEQKNADLVKAHSDLQANKAQVERTNADLVIAHAELAAKKAEVERKNADLSAASLNSQALALEAMASRLAVQSLVESDSETAALLAVEALRRDRNIETEAAMWQSLSRPARLQLRHDRVSRMDVSSDGRFAASLSQRELKLWDVVRGQELARAAVAVESNAPLAIAPAGDHVFVGGQAGSPLAFHLVDGQLKTVEPSRSGDHQGPITRMASSPDGRWLAAGDANGRLTLWRIGERSLSLHAVPPPHARPVLDLAFDATGRWLASIGSDRVLHVFDTESGIAVPLPPDTGEPPPGPSRGQPRLLFVNDTLLLHRPNERLEVRSAPAFERSDDVDKPDAATPALLAPGSGSQLWGAASDGTLTSMRVEGEDLRFDQAFTAARFSSARIGLPAGLTLNAMAYSGERHLMAFAGRGHLADRRTHVVVFGPPSAASAAPIAATLMTMPTPIRVQSVAFADRGRMLLLLRGDGVVERLSLVEGQALEGQAAAPPGMRAVRAIALADDGGVVGLDADHGIFQRVPGSRFDLRGDDTPGGRRESDPAPHLGPWTARRWAAVSGESALVASPKRLGADGKLQARLAWLAPGQLLEMPTGEETQSVQALAGSRARLVAWAIKQPGKGSRIKVWHAQSKQERHSWEIDGEVLALALSPDAAWLAAVVLASESATANRGNRPARQPRLMTYRLAAGAAPEPGPTFRVQGDDEDAYAVEYSPQSRWLIVANEAEGVSELHAWPQRGHAPGSPLRLDSTRIAFAADDSRLAFFSRSSGLMLLAPVAEGARPQRLLPGDAAVQGLALSPDGRTLLAGARDGSIHVLDAMSGAPRALLRWGHRHAVTAIAFSPDGRTAVSGDQAGNLATWSMSNVARSFNATDALCERASRNLGFASWKAYFKNALYEPTCRKLPIAPDVTRGLIEQAWRAVDEGRRTEARVLVRRMVELSASETNAHTLNDLCYRAALTGFGTEALPLCQRAVDALPGDPDVRDSRAVALLLAGRRSQALADFEFFVRHADSTHWARDTRRAWIDGIKRGRMPLDARALKTERERL